ncbi:MAG: patatin-like phospholipase family protein [Pseudomonadota bacterium]
MDAVKQRLKALSAFRNLETDTLDAIAARGRWMSLSGGWELFAEGDRAAALHIILSGRLIVVRNAPEGDEVVGYIRAGEPVGEMSLLSGEARSASVYALRDTELLTLRRDDVDRLFNDHGDFAAAMARTILGRSRYPKASFQQSAPRVFALIGSSPSIDVDGYAKKLAERVRGLGLNADFMPDADEAPDGRLFDYKEEANDVLIVAARVDGSPWYRFVVRHADRFLVMARRDARPPQPFPMTEEAGARARNFRLVDLVMINEGVPACPITDWQDTVGAVRSIAVGGERSLDRLARIIAGKSVALVLSGGGARAFAHIGALKALNELGVPVDFVSGTSMGAVIGGCVAMGWSLNEIEDHIREGFVVSNPLSDYVLPVVSLTKGRRVDRRLKKHFGDVRIEDLALPFFCVSANLVDGSSHIHRRGRLRDALRASISLPGILPPVVDDDALLVDGGLTNNLPTDLMANMHRGITIGIDVARKGMIDPDAFENPPGFLQWVMRHGFSAAPPIVSLLMRAATARHEHTLKVHPADIMILPEVPTVNLRDWKSYDAAVEAGYLAAKEALAEESETLIEIARAARA